MSQKWCKRTHSNSQLGAIRIRLCATLGPRDYNHTNVRDSRRCQLVVTNRAATEKYKVKSIIALMSLTVFWAPLAAAEHGTCDQQLLTIQNVRVFDGQASIHSEGFSGDWLQADIESIERGEIRGLAT